MTDVYLKFENHIKTERNGEGELTHYYEGEYSVDGEFWESCVLIFSSELDKHQFYNQNKEEIAEVRL